MINRGSSFSVSCTFCHPQIRFMALTGEMCLFMAIERLAVKIIWVEVIEKRADRALTLLGCGVPCGEPMRCKERQIQIKLRWALFVTYTIIQSIMRREMCSLHLTHPSAHTPGAVGSRHCGARGAVGGSVPCSRVSPQSWTLPARAGIRTHNLGLPQVSSPTLYPLGHDCPVR